MQLEFPFSLPFVLAEQAKLDEERRFWNDLFQKLPFPKIDFPISELFQKIEWTELEDGHESFSFPMTVLKGNPNQPEFPFVRAIDESYWGYPVEYEYERLLNWRNNLIVDKI